MSIYSVPHPTLLLWHQLIFVPLFLAKPAQSSLDRSWGQPACSNYVHTWSFICLIKLIIILINMLYIPWSRKHTRTHTLVYLLFRRRIRWKWVDGREKAIVECHVGEIFQFSRFCIIVKRRREKLAEGGEGGHYYVIEVRQKGRSLVRMDA